MTERAGALLVAVLVSIGFGVAHHQGEQRRDVRAQWAAALVACANGGRVQIGATVVQCQVIDINVRLAEVRQ